MGRENGIRGRAVIFLASAVVLLTSLGLSAFAADHLSTLFVPPLTDEEMAEYQKIADNKSEVQKFIATRLFLRKLASYAAELPKGVEYEAIKHGSPQPSKEVDIKYALTFDEQVVLYNNCLLCGGCGDKEEDKPTGDPNCGLSHPKTIDCGTPVDKNSVLSQLTPPVSPEEIRLFEKANACALPEMPRFLATRKYIRQIKALKAGLPAGKKFDPRSAPRLPDLLDASYMLFEKGDEGDDIHTLFEIQSAHMLDDLSIKGK